jgi:hypothetical protein
VAFSFSRSFPGVDGVAFILVGNVGCPRRREKTEETGRRVLAKQQEPNTVSSSRIEPLQRVADAITLFGVVIAPAGFTTPAAGGSDGESPLTAALAISGLTKAV